MCRYMYNRDITRKEKTMNSFNTQLQIEDMWHQDEYEALLWDCEMRMEKRQDDLDDQELHWENVWMDINNEWADNQPKPF